MKYHLLIDESGNHDLKNVDPSFPIFVLCAVLISDDEFKKLNSKINTLKKTLWGDKSICFHSRDIRKCQNGFEVLFDLEKKAFFYGSVNDIVRDTRYTIIAAAINKQAYINKYKDTYDVYGIALEFIMERTVFKLDEFTGNPELHVMVEKRGDKEDKKLRSQYDLLLSEGTRFIDTKRLNAYFKSFDFQCKKDNNCGLEFTDLVAYPIARHVIDTDKVNLAYDVLKDKIYTRNGKMYGLKTFPI